jgi:hypothetical protein
MTTIQDFTGSLGFVIIFLTGTLFFTMIFDEDVTFWYLLLVLAGMVYTNWDRIAEAMGRLSKA